MKFEASIRELQFLGVGFFVGGLAGHAVPEAGMITLFVLPFGFATILRMFQKATKS